MSFRYIGSKARVVEGIIDRIGEPDGGTFVDAFCGTGAVAAAASRAGWPVLVNDHLTSSAMTSLARVVPSDHVHFRHFGGYEKAVDELNQAPPRCGFIWKEYSPASSSFCDVSRMYFTEENAQRIDGIRRKISEWSDL